MSSVCFWFHIIGVLFFYNYGATASPYDRVLREYEVLADESVQAESPAGNMNPMGFMGSLEENVPDFNDNFLNEMGGKFNFLKPHLEANKESSAEESAEKSKRSSDKRVRRQEARGVLDDRLSGMTDRFQSFGNMTSITDNANLIPGVGSYVPGNKESEASASESEKTKRNIQEDAGDKFSELASGWPDKIQSMAGGMGGGNQENGDSDKPNPVDKLTEMFNKRRGGC